MSTDKQATSSKTSPALTEAQKEALLIFQNFNSSKKNYVELEGTVMEKPKPSTTQRTDAKGNVISEQTYYKLNFAFLGGATTESVDEATYHSANVGDIFTLYGTIKTIGDNREYSDKQTGEQKKFTTTSLALTISQIVPKNLLSYISSLSA